MILTNRQRDSQTLKLRESLNLVFLFIISKQINSLSSKLLELCECGLHVCHTKMTQNVAFHIFSLSYICHELLSSRCSD